jgi:hypothetical protein
MIDPESHRLLWAEITRRIADDRALLDQLRAWVGPFAGTCAPSSPAAPSLSPWSAPPAEETAKDITANEGTTNDISLRPGVWGEPVRSGSFSRCGRAISARGLGYAPEPTALPRAPTNRISHRNG